MIEARFTFVADGSSDRALMPVLEWLLRFHCQKCVFEPQWADLTMVPKRKRPGTLAEKLLLSVELFPCELLFVHRDAEREIPQKRYQEIDQAVQTAGLASLPVVCVVPVRMQEAWLLFDEVALRRAASNPNG
ncbi:hypothetical protein [Gloeobacter kilaueensis]|uniref:hypothetical protein n=1 Tax=Gloeobacter kilaueensis TaxID=1416614 RepID=UPI001CB70CED|nr:hypothetical protein [Gloeobacter kilaueensis]